jgi:hypothetical protein
MKMNGGEKMKLITKDVEALFKKIGRQEGNPDPTVLAHFFNPCGPGNWWATEMYYVIKKAPANGESKLIEVEASKMNGEIGGYVVDVIFFGYVSIHGDFCDEWGYFSLSELRSVKCPPFGLGIERNLYFDPKPISKVCPKAIGKK